ncbi:S-adenosyl-L-methionine-dependent methyltransferase [Amylostereum chailletii]|nr:S-adenosyl-L-methionine-dependent methyltransferase [Amylostereum chailletii]
MAGVNAQEYPLEPASQSTLEWERLDAVHNAFTKYCGDNLSFAPLNPSETHSVLEVGCGSGAWAIDAATRFPHADVVAVDMSPLPAREIPSNIHFFQLNIQDEVPFKAETFDVVHARLLLIHSSDPQRRSRHQPAYHTP